MSQNLPPLQARTLSITGATFQQVKGWQKSGPCWLVLYATSSTDGVVWISTQDGLDGAANTLAAVSDRRPINVPGQFYLGPYDSLAIGVAEEGSHTITCEVTPHPIQPVRIEVSAAQKCER